MNSFIRVTTHLENVEKVRGFESDGQKVRENMFLSVVCCGV